MPSVSNPIAVLSNDENHSAAPVLAIISDTATQSSNRIPPAELDWKKWENILRLMSFAIIAKIPICKNLGKNNRKIRTSAGCSPFKMIGSIFFFEKF